MLEIHHNDKFVEELNTVTRTKDIASFLCSLNQKDKEKWRDSHIMTLLFYTCENREEMIAVLKGYLRDLDKPK